SICESLESLIVIMSRREIDLSQMQTDQPLVEFHGVSYGVAGVASLIVSDLNLTVQRGETLVLLGESGCGQTTTLRLVHRRRRPTPARRCGACARGRAAASADG